LKPTMNCSVYIKEPKDNLDNPKYANDLEVFYNTFSDRSRPDNICKFADISLMDCHINKECIKNIYIEDKSELVIKTYADLLRLMLYNINKSKDELVDILKTLIVVANDKIVINQNLVSSVLDDCILRTTNILVKMYLNYSKDKENIDKILDIYLETSKFRKFMRLLN
jgi:hypothetical protein